MPRAQADSTTASETKTKKAPVKRTARRTKPAASTTTATKRRTTARTRTKKDAVETPVVTKSVVETPARKAPTPIAATAARSRRSRIILGIATFLCVACVGAGVYVGVSESGTIDVNTIIQTGNEQISRGEFVDSRTGQTVTRTISAQSDSRRTNSGLRASAPTEPEVPVTAPESSVADSGASTTATSTTSTTDDQLPTATTTASEAATTSDTDISSGTAETDPL